MTCARHRRPVIHFSSKKSILIFRQGTLWWGFRWFFVDQRFSRSVRSRRVRQRRKTSNGRRHLSNCSSLFQGNSFETLTGVLRNLQEETRWWKNSRWHLLQSWADNDKKWVATFFLRQIAWELKVVRRNCFLLFVLLFSNNCCWPQAVFFKIIRWW